MFEEILSKIDIDSLDCNFFSLFITAFDDCCKTTTVIKGIRSRRKMAKEFILSAYEYLLKIKKYAYE